MTSPDVRIRRIAPADVPAVARLTVDVYVGEGYTREATRSWTENVEARLPQGEILVAVCASGEIVGTVTLASPPSPLAHITGDDESEIRLLAVARSARGAGVGHALMKAAIGRARSMQRSAVVLSTQPTMLAAHRLYERLGFERTPALDWTAGDGKRRWTYRLALRSSASGAGAGVL